MNIIMNCPKCGRPLEGGEMLIGDGCMYCSSPSFDINPEDRQSNEPMSPLAYLIVVIIAIGTLFLIVRGFLWLLGV